MDNTFIGEIKSMSAGYSKIVTLTMLPLQLQRGRYVFTLAINGDERFNGRVGDLGDFDEWWARITDNVG
jgi:hypothetical protein